MGKLKYTILLLFNFLLCVLAQSQIQATDSMQKLLLQLNEDSIKVNTLNSLASELLHLNIDTAFFFAQQANELATKINYEIGIADAKINEGKVYAAEAKYYQGIKIGNEAFVLYSKILESTKAKNYVNFKIADCYNLLVLNNFPQGNYPEALRLSFLELKLRDKIGDKKGASNAEFNIGNIYYCQHSYLESLEHYNGSLLLCKQLKDSLGISSTYSAIGLVYYDQGNYSKASEYYSAALKTGQKINDSFNLAEIYVNLVLLEDKLNNYSAALDYGSIALNIYERTGLSFNIPFVLNNMAMVYLKQKKYNEAAKFLERALVVANQTSHREYIKLSYENLAILDSAEGNYSRALKHYKLAAGYKDSLLNEKNTRALVEQQMQYNFDKKEALTRAEQQQKDEIALRTKYVLLISLISVIIISLLVFNRYKFKKKAETKQTLLNERLRISRELHDEIGSTLSGISMYSHLTREQLKSGSKGDVEKSLNVMQQSSGEMVRKLNDMVWLINPAQNSINKIIERLEDYASDMAAIKNIQIKIITPEHLHELSLPMETCRNVYLFCKEGINNAVKYSGATMLVLKIKQTNNLLEFSITDDGKGFDETEIKPGNGLSNMKARGAEINAEYTLQSQPGKGTTLTLKIKLPQ